MMERPALLLPWLALFVTTHLAAHQITMTQSDSTATSLSLSYADGSPFAYVAYELFPAHAQLPTQVGRTDAQGRVVFIPDTPGEWRIKAFSEDGHGIDQRFIPTSGDSPRQTSTAGRLNWPAALLTGLGALFGLFGLQQLFLRRQGTTKGD